MGDTGSMGMGVLLAIVAFLTNSIVILVFIVFIFFSHSTHHSLQHFGLVELQQFPHSNSFLFYRSSPSLSPPLTRLHTLYMYFLITHKYKDLHYFFHMNSHNTHIKTNKTSVCVSLTVKQTQTQPHQKNQKRRRKLLTCTQT